MKRAATVGNTPMTQADWKPGLLNVRFYIFHPCIRKNYCSTIQLTLQSMKGGGGAVRPPVIFGPFPKKSSGNPYLKICDLTKLFLMALSEHPVQFFFALIKNSSYKP